LNFAPVVLSVPSTVSVRKVDLAVELQILSYHEQRKANMNSRQPDGVQVQALPADRPRGVNA
jgi:redox-sensing transcriptional repressor